MSEHLELFYNSLRNSLLKKYKESKYPSILVWFIEIKSNDRLRILQSSHIRSSKIPRDVLNNLLNGKLIRETDILGEYVITAYGVWVHENKKDIISNEILLQNLDDKFFNAYEEIGKPFSDREKIIIFSMIAARAFSELSPVYLKREEPILDTWEEIINKSYILLKSLGVVGSLTESGLFGKQGNEHKVSALVRHTDKIPKKTKGIYVCAETRDQKYYLDLFKNDKISTENLKFLFRLILGEKKLSISEIDAICSFCDNIASSKSIYIFDIKQHKFHDPVYDAVIRDTLLIL